ncbi:rabenosyn-5-like [Physella acuta]|uniref:rabenosyn-5-like n=1 Tax=Physella acuta TaxID=109671 RepID=UPI0027DDE60E|nr:rabenosyn-5-like [Physella acuta]XP_059165515.1 rabenosyn-5-like [Physella acuta]XP_059165516.1 rabenosyn-5-like [Physella acuta]
MSADIIEGFLCPICMKDLGTVSQLQGHFEEEHSSEDKAVFQQLKGFFDKARKRILGDRVESDVQQGEVIKRDELGGLSGYDPSWWEYQEIGAARSHTDSYKSIRDARVNHFVVETNKLLIRLDKLLSPDAPIDPKKRKAYEKGIVRWIPDNEVPACLNCGKSFGILTRRHHCRLCGGIMCDRCSEFMASSYAQKLVNPSHTFSGEGFLKRTNSNTSLNSLVGNEGESIMRVCKMCRRLLERRDMMTELRNTKPAIVQIYDKMKMCIQDAEQILPDYLPMVESLSQGESQYDYRQAQIMRTKLVKLYEAVDQLSKKILGLDLNSEQGNNPKQIHLQKAIRLYASNFMQENLMGLQALPSEEDYNKLREKRASEIQRKIAAERQAAMNAQEKERQDRERIERERLVKDGLASPEDGPKPGHRRAASGGEIQKKKMLVGKIPVPNVIPKGLIRNQSDENMGKGWKPVEDTARVSTATDPMLQQMEIIKGYIRQAKQANRTDEIIMLEQNLQDLYAEYMRQQQQKEHFNS